MYLANPCSPAVLELMSAGELGLIDQPNQNKVAPVVAAHEAGATWCADNGCFSDKWDQGRWWAFLERNAHRASTCLFAVAPDVVGDAAATTELFSTWGSRIRELGYPVAYVAQDGLEHLPIPWDGFDCLFVGGSTEWKLGDAARAIVVQAKARGKWVHMGRVNSERRYEYARAIGCDSADGTFLTFGPDTNLQRLLKWIRNNEQPGLFGGAS